MGEAFRPVTDGGDGGEHPRGAQVTQPDSSLKQVSSSAALPKRPNGVAERFRQFEVILVLTDEQPYRLAGGFDPGGDFAVLALELGGFAGAICDNQRRV